MHVQMDGLVELCAQFIANHVLHFARIEDLVALPGDLFNRVAKVNAYTGSTAFVSSEAGCRCWLFPNSRM